MCTGRISQCSNLEGIDSVRVRVVPDEADRALDVLHGCGVLETRAVPVVHNEESVSRIAQLGNKDPDRRLANGERHSIITERGGPTTPWYDDDPIAIHLRWPMNVHQ